MRLLYLIMLSTGFAWMIPPAPSVVVDDATVPQVRFIQVEPDVKLEVLDWGGSGPPLVLLTGLGNTAHVYADFAHQFTDKYAN